MSDESEARIRHIVDALGLEPHPEGGFFRETYRSDLTLPPDVLPERYDNDRSCSTAIYFLLPEGARSVMHRLKSDEVWHFYLGGPLTLVQLTEDGIVDEVVLGPDLWAGHRLQHSVPGGCWFGAHPNPGSGFSLVGCTVAPGFEFDDFEMGKQDELVEEFPHAREIIERLTDA